MISRRTWLAVTGIGAAAAVGGCGFARSVSEPARVDRDAQAFEFFPAETWHRTTVVPDGSLLVRTEVLFDAGEGQDRPLECALSREMVLLRGRPRPVVRPVADGLGARHLSHGGAPLAVEQTETNDSVARWTLQRAGGWAPGRHLVTLEHRVMGVWVAVGGDRRLVLTGINVWAPWYGAGGGFAATEVFGQPPAWLVDTTGQETPVPDPAAVPRGGSDVLYAFIRPGLDTVPPPAVVVGA